MPRNTVRFCGDWEGSCCADQPFVALTRTGKLVNPWEWVETLPKDEPVVFIFGAMAHGHIDKENTNYVRRVLVVQKGLRLKALTYRFFVLQLDEQISISEYPLSGAHAITRLLNAFERHWGIL